VVKPLRFVSHGQTYGYVSSAKRNRSLAGTNLLLQLNVAVSSRNGVNNLPSVVTQLRADWKSSTTFKWRSKSHSTITPRYVEGWSQCNTVTQLDGVLLQPGNTLRLCHLMYLMSSYLLISCCKASVSDRSSYIRS